MNALPKRQRLVLKTIQSYKEQNGFVPTVRELNLLLGTSSTCTMQRHIDALVRKGCLQRTAGKARCLVVLEQNEG